MTRPSPFEFPASLQPHHVEELSRRGISQAFAIESGVRFAADNELRKMGFEASIPADQRKNGLQGICFAYVDLSTGQHIAYRIKPDRKFVIGDKPSKYISRLGEKVRAYYPHTTTAEMAADPKFQVLLTEGEFKALSLAENIVPIASRKTCVIGLAGVNGGWHRDKLAVTLPTGEKETRKEGHAHLIDDLDCWEWKKRVVYIVFDSDVATRAHATEFKRNKKSGAWGAEYTLALLLRARGAEVRIVTLPGKFDGTKRGADDLIVDLGKHETLKLIYNAWVVERNPDEVLYQPSRALIQIESMEDLIRSAPERPKLVIDKILPEGCVAVLAGASGAGKSMLALNACHAVATGGRFLDLLPCQKGRSLYLQCEMPRWALAERGKGLGETNPNFELCTLGTTAPLNYWEPDGFNKRRETGNRELVMALLDQIKARAPRVVCFDSLKDFTSLSISDPDAAKHMMEIFRMIAQAARCGVLLIHHHIKTGGREKKYEGADDAGGAWQFQAAADSILSLYEQKRADNTVRYKMVFSKLRHSAPMDPVEINRMSGSDSLSWRATPWESNTKAELSPDDKFIEALDVGPCDYKTMMKRARIGQSTVYDVANRLEAKGIIGKNGTLYYLIRNDAN